MPSTAEQAIYDRLASAPSFHPASAELLLNDWTLEPGDVVTVKSGESNYNLPIYSLNLNWTGSNIGGAENSNTTRITIESTGNKEREPLPELRRKQFEQDRFAYGGFRAQQQEIDEHYQHVVEVTDQGMSDAFGILGVSIGADGMPAKDSSGNYIWDDSGTGGEIWGHLNRNAWTSVIQNHIQDANGNILSIAKVLTSADGQALIQAINDQQTGTATINADRVRIDGAVTIGDAFGVSSGSLLVKTMAIFGSSGNLVTINNGKVSAETVQINSSGALTFGDGTGYGYRSINATTAGNLVTGFGASSESGGQITIPYYTVGIPAGSGGSAGNINFNIAATQYYLDHVAAAYGNAVGRVVWPNTPRSQSSFSVSAPTNPWNAAQEIGTTENRVFALSNDGQFDATTHITTVNLEMSHSAGGQTVLDGVVATIAIDASDVYTSGQGSVQIQGQITKTYTSNGWKSVIYPDYGYSGISAVQIHVDVPIPDPPAYSASGWGITAAAGGGTKVELYVDGNHFSHTFENYP